MEYLFELLKILLPALIVLYLSFLLVRSFLQNKLDELVLKQQYRAKEIITPIRLQAYERCILLMERVSLGQLITRIGGGDYTVEEFQQILIHEIRNEFNHNLSQQVYISKEAWICVTNIVEQTISFINSKVMSIDSKEKWNLLAMELLSEDNRSLIQFSESSKDLIKAEIQKLF